MIDRLPVVHIMPRPMQGHRAWLSIPSPEFRRAASPPVGARPSLAQAAEASIGKGSK